MKKMNSRMLIIMIIIAVILLIFIISMLFKGLNLTQKDGVEVIVDTLSGDINGISKDDFEIINKYPVYMENKYSNALTVVEMKKIINMIDEVLVMFNNADYAGISSKLPLNYKESQFTTEQDFQKYLDVLLANASDYVCSYYDVTYHGVECILKSPSTENSFRVKIAPNVTYSDYQVYLRSDIVNLRDRNFSFYINGISFNIKYEVKCADTLEFVTVIKNNNKNTVNCSFLGSNSEANYRGTARTFDLLSPINEVILQPKEEKTITLVFDVNGRETLKQEYLNIVCTINGKEQSTKITIDTENEELAP